MSNQVTLDRDFNRLYTLCPAVTSKFKLEELVMTCNRACGGRFYARCCFHMKSICHSSRIVYTDGACSNNGRVGAVAGIGVAFGIRNGDPDDEDTCQFSIPVDDRLDPGGRRTSQRAEPLAALEGLKRICDYDEEGTSDCSKRQEQHLDSNWVIIITDSEYVVKGMTEWLPKWKKNGLRKANGQRPSNLDLFCTLDAEIEKRECKHGCKVMFWHIDRAYNTIADRLAKHGASTAAHAVNVDLEEVISATEAWSL